MPLIIRYGDYEGEYSHGKHDELLEHHNNNDILYSDVIPFIESTS